MFDKLMIIQMNGLVPSIIYFDTIENLKTLKLRPWEDKLEFDISQAKKAYGTL